MESIGPLAGTVRSKSKQALLLWLDGVREACCLHRVIIYSLRSKQLVIRTGQCFLLNGFIFLGSIFVLKSVSPALEWILPGHCPLINSQESCSFSSILEFYRLLRVGLVQLFYVFWFYPLYIFSLILSNIWYNDIAKHGFFALENYGAHDTNLSGQKESQTLQNTVHRENSTDLEGIMISIAEQLYSVLLLTFFFVEVYVTGFIPYIGKGLNFMLLSWLYAYYCFEYKWNLSGLSLDKRLDFFESNWAFFAGFVTWIIRRGSWRNWKSCCHVTRRSRVRAVETAFCRNAGKSLCPGNIFILSTSELWGYGYIVSTVCFDCYRLGS